MKIEAYRFYIMKTVFFFIYIIVFPLEGYSQLDSLEEKFSIKEIKKCKINQDMNLLTLIDSTSFFVIVASYNFNSKILTNGLKDTAFFFGVDSMQFGTNVFSVKFHTKSHFDIAKDRNIGPFRFFTAINFYKGYLILEEYTVFRKYLNGKRGKREKIKKRYVLRLKSV